MKPLLKKSIIFFTICLLGYGIYYYFFKTTTSTSVTRVTTVVTKWTIENSIKTTGTAKLINEQKIRFNQAGKVTAIYFKEWKNVKKGQIIAEIDNTNALNSIKQAEIDLNNSKITLLSDQKPPEQKDILQQENAVGKTQLDIENQNLTTVKAKTEYDSSVLDAQNKITQKQTDIESKKAQLTLLQNQLNTLLSEQGKGLSDTNTDVQKSVQSAYTDVRKYLIDANDHLKTVNDIFAFDDNSPNKDADYLMFIAGKNTSLKETSKTDYLNSKNLYAKYNTLYSSLHASSITSNQAIDLLKNISELYDSLVTLGNGTMTAMNSSIPSLPNFSQNIIDSHYNSLSQLTTQSQSTYSTLQSSISSLKKLSDPDLQKQQNDDAVSKQKSTINDQQTAIDNAQNDLKSLQNNLEVLTENYNTQVKQSEITLKNLQSTLALNQANLEYIQKWATAEQIQRDKNDIARKQLAIQDAEQNLDKYRIEAPFDGILRQIDFKVWDNIVSDDSKYIYIDNPNLIEITAQLDQIDIAKIQAWQEVKIAFDSYTDASFTGSVTQINTTPISTSWVTSYEIKVSFDKWEHSIYSWMTAKIEIITNKKSDVLILPSQFVTSGSWGITTVLSVQGKKKEVVVWITTSSQSEIVSWLEEGDKVVRLITISTSSTTSSSKTWTSSSSSSRRNSSDMWWMGWPPPWF